MQTAIGVGGAASGGRRDWPDQVRFVTEAEKLGVDFVWTAEAWGQDAISPLAYLAGVTSKIRLGTGIMQISARAPVMTAMTALTMAAISEDRFVLGLGVSGPQVVEGLHGRPFKAPLTRLRETVDIIRLAFAGEKIQYEGKHHVLPLPGGEGKAIRLAQPGNPDIPIYLATLAPNSLVATGEIADGWVGTSFVPEHANVHFDHLAKGAQKRGRGLDALDLQAGGSVEFSDDVDALIAKRKGGVAFTLGAMGSADHNFYNDAFRRAGYEEAGIEVQKLWKAGNREEATRLVPDDLVLLTNMIGTEDMVRDRIRAYRDAGVDTLRIAPEGDGIDGKIETLGRALDLVREVNAEAA